MRIDKSLLCLRNETRNTCEPHAFYATNRTNSLSFEFRMTEVVVFRITLMHLQGISENRRRVYFAPNVVGCALGFIRTVKPVLV